MKTCTKCLTEKSTSEFYRRARSSDGLTARCRECLKADTTAQYEATADTRRKGMKAWRERNLAWAREYARNWKSEHPEYERARKSGQSARRRSTLSQGTVTAVQVVDLIERFRGECAYCTAPWEHLDHYVPLARGGIHDIVNLVPACADHNLRKGAKMPDDFLEEVDHGS